MAAATLHIHGEHHKHSRGKLAQTGLPASDVAATVVRLVFPQPARPHPLVATTKCGDERAQRGAGSSNFAQLALRVATLHAAVRLGRTAAIGFLLKQRADRRIVPGIDPGQAKVLCQLAVRKRFGLGGQRFEHDIGIDIAMNSVLKRAG